MRYTEKSVIAKLVAIAADLGERVHLDAKEAKRFAEVPKLAAAIVTDMKEAWKCEAFILERPFYGNYRHGYRVCRYSGGGSAQRDVSRMFPTAGEAVNALDMVQAISYEAARPKAKRRVRS